MKQFTFDKLSKINIDSYGYTFRITDIPEGFWKEWKEHKNELKQQGLRPTKQYADWYLYVYDGNKVTNTELKEYQKSQVATYLCEFPECQTDEEQELLNKLEDCNTVDEVDDLIVQHQDLFENHMYVIAKMRSLLFNRNCDEEKINSQLQQSWED